MSERDIRADVLVIGCGIAGASAALEAAKAGLETVVITKVRRPEESNTYLRPGRHRLVRPRRPARAPQDGHPRGRRPRRRPGGRRHPGRGRPALVREYAHRQAQDPLHPELARRPRLRPGGRALAPPHSPCRGRYRTDDRGPLPPRPCRKHPRVTLLAGPDGRRPPDRAAPLQGPRRLLPRAPGDRRLRPRQRDGRGRPGLRAVHGAGHGRLRRRLPPHLQPARGRRLRLRHGPAGRGPDRQHGVHPVPSDASSMREKGDGFLISEAVRGEGARLKTRDGKTFMEKYTPRRDLAPRDEVARAIYEEMILTNSNYVLLDLASYAKPADIRERFPTIYRTCLEDGIDITRPPIPVVPGGPLLLRRRPGRRLGADVARRALRRRRGRLHGRPRRQPPGLDLAPRGPRLGDAGRPRHRRPLRRCAVRTRRPRSTAGTTPRTRRPSTRPSSTRTG